MVYENIIERKFSNVCDIFCVVFFIIFNCVMYFDKNVFMFYDCYILKCFEYFVYDFY